jgi:transposase
MCRAGLGEGYSPGVCVLEVDGEPLLQRGFTHDERNLDEMCELLVELEVRRIAIERPDGVLVEPLLEAGLVVLPIHPNQLKAARPRFLASGGKSDSFDAFCLAELARTDNHRFRVLVPDSDETKALRALTRAREDLVKTKVSLTNRLQAELDAFWPGAATIFSAGSTRRSHWLSSSAIRVPRMLGLWAKSASLASSPAMATAGGSPP